MIRFAAALLVASCLVSPALAQTAVKPAPVADLVRAIDIPFQTFTLANGLRVVVHTDRKAPVVAVSVWYDVGSKNEPGGKTGFAHLFEHLMFNGSENAPGDFFEPLKAVGATDMNGTTYFDRTNYYETVPTAALDRALFLESDRMGHLTGAITQSVLDEQRGVVQNEKRQGDNQPYGLTQYKLIEGLFPKGHPYGHTTIGAMADLDKASLADVKGWFRDHYGPNNAVLVLAGDIDAAQARPLVSKYFGAIPRGPQNALPNAPVPTLPAPVNEVMKDRVAATMVMRAWAVPGLKDKDAAALDVAASVLGGLASSRLDNVLVKQDKLAVQVSAENETFSQLGMFSVTMIVRDGVDVATATRRLDQLVAEFVAKGPSADEVGRAVTTDVARSLTGLESVGGGGGKAVALAEGELYANDPAFYKKELAELAGQTPASVTAAMRRWLTRPAYGLTVVPGERDKYDEAVVPPPAAVTPAPETSVEGTRGAMPGVGEPSALSFPTVERTRLSNGIELVYAQRSVVPQTQLTLSFDAGTAADVPGRLGTQRLVLAMLDEGMPGLNSVEIAEAKERLGADIGTGASQDRTTLSLRVPSANLAPALALFGDLARRPTFPEGELARVRDQQLAGIAQELTTPDALGARVLPPLVYGANSPYAKPGGSGDPAAVARLTRADLVAFQQAWLRPEKAKVFVVSDRPLAEVRALLDRTLGDWRGTGTAGVKSFADPGAPSPAKIVLVDRPDSPQSLILAGAPTPLVGTADLLPVLTANDALGGDFTARINMDLREARHWSYGAYGYFRRAEQATPYWIQAPVQADKTGASIASLREDVSGFLGTKPLTPAEFALSVESSARELAGQFETSGAVLQAMQTNDLYRRPDDYYATLTQKYRALTLPQVAGAARAAIDPRRFVWVVVGDARVVRPQLDLLGLPVEVVPAASVAGAPQESK
jgi:zinc protease